MRTSPKPIRMVLAVALGLVLAFPSVAPATPTVIEQRQLQAQAAREELDRLSAELEAAGEELAEIEENLEMTRQEVVSAREDTIRAERELEDAKEALGRRVNQTYRIGGGSYLEVLVGSSSFSELVTRIAFMTKLAQSDARLIDAVKVAKAEFESKQAVFERRLSEEESLRAAAQEKAESINAALGRQRATIDSLDAEIAQLIEEQRAREAAEAAAAAERARLAAEAAARAGGTSSGGVSVPGAGGPGITRAFNPAALGAPRPQVVEVVKKYLGVPYVWGGSTPAGFDCSGLVQYAYREIGISIPRTSRTQFSGISGYIPPDRTDLLQPGDLVFFGTGGDQSKIHHVGMYVGGGSYIHAPQTGDVVRYADLSRRSDYVGATRP